jgi:hypothetical protein
MTPCARRPQEADEDVRTVFQIGNSPDFGKVLTANRSATMVGSLGVAGGTMAITQDKRVERIAAFAAPGSKDAKENKAARNHAAANAAPAPSRWIRNINDYDRRERREYQVSRFG